MASKHCQSLTLGEGENLIEINIGLPPDVKSYLTACVQTVTWGVRMIDWKQVRALKDEVGAEDFDEVVALFLEEVEEVTNRLRKDVDFSALEADMHFLKGSALSLGFAAFSQQCHIGEKLSAMGKMAEVDVPAVLECFVASKTVFLSELPQLP